MSHNLPERQESLELSQRHSQNGPLHDQSDRPQTPGTASEASLEEITETAPTQSPSINEREHVSQTSHAGLVQHIRDAASPAIPPAVNGTVDSATPVQHNPTTATTVASSPQEPKRSAYRTWQDVANRWWLYEVIGLIISTIALGGLVAILATFNGKPRPQWPSKISVNALVSVMATVLQGCLMLPITESISELKWHWYKAPRPLADLETFDAASRGPWGSFLFMCSLRRFSLATLGATITLCALAIGPFSQQVVDYQPCLRPSPREEARIPRTNAYSTSAFPGITGYGQSGAAVLDNVMTLSIYEGLLSPPANGSSLISPTCPTGNCTFPSDNGASYTSVAMCYKAWDISRDIQNDTVSRFPNYSLPSGLRLNSYIDPTLMLVTTVPTFAKTGDYEEIVGGMLFTFEALMYRIEPGSDNQPGLFAVRSSIYPCIKTWHGSVALSVLHETEISSIAMTPQGADGFGKYFAHITNEALRNGTWDTCEPTSQNQTYGIDVHSGGQITSVANGTSSDCLWLLSYGANVAIQAFLTNLFNDNSISGSVPGVSWTVIDADLWLRNFYLDGKITMSTVDAYMQGLVFTMTATIRSRGDSPIAPYTNYASGTVLQSVECVYAHWQWLALPASVVLGAIVFLLTTIISTYIPKRRRLAGGPYEPRKSSALALLFHGLHPDTLRSVEQPKNVGKMEDIAENLDVKFGKWADNTWHLLGEH
jgi:hypothetical protein